MCVFFVKNKFYVKDRFWGFVYFPASHPESVFPLFFCVSQNKNKISTPPFFSFGVGGGGERERGGGGGGGGGALISKGKGIMEVRWRRGGEIICYSFCASMEMMCVGWTKRGSGLGSCHSKGRKVRVSVSVRVASVYVLASVSV